MYDANTDRTERRNGSGMTVKPELPDPNTAQNQQTEVRESRPNKPDTRRTLHPTTVCA